MSDLTFSQARAEISKWGNFLRALGKIEETADAVASQVQLQSEREQILAKLSTDITAARTAYDAARSETVDLIANAGAQASTLVAQAQADAQKLASEAKAIAAAARLEAETAAATVQAAIATRDEIKTDLNAARAELERVHGLIEDAKAEARRRFGS